MATGLRSGAHRRTAPRHGMGRSSFGLQKKLITENAKPDAWSMWRVKHPEWPHILGKTEWRLEWFVYWCRDLAIFEVLEFAGRVSIIIAVIVWFWEWEDRTKQSHYRAWELINSARDSTGDGGRRDALQDLNEDGVNLSAAPLAKAYLFEVVLPKANLSGANLSEANLSEADLTGAILASVTLTGADLTEANLSEANLSEADLTGADLRWANLTEANLTGANLTKADLRWANLTGAILDWANLTEANLTGADRSKTQLCQTTMPDGTLNNRDCYRNQLRQNPSETPPAPN